MNSFKTLVIFVLVIAAVVWAMTTGVTWWRRRKIQNAIDLYVEKKGYHPRSLSVLDQEYETGAGKTSRFLEEIPSLGADYCWEYSESEAAVELKEVPADEEDSSLKVCP